MADSDFLITSDDAGVLELFKNFYPKRIDNAYKYASPLLKSISQKKPEQVVGRSIVKGVSLSLLGGFSAGTKAFGSSANFLEKQTSYAVKNIRHEIRVDRLTKNLASTNEGAFKRIMDVTMSKQADAIQMHKSRMLVGAGTGLLGTISAVSTASAVHTCTLSDYVHSKWVTGEVVELVRSATKQSALYEVTRTDYVNSKVILTQVDGASLTPIANDTVYIQNAYHATTLNEWIGIDKVLSTTSGTLYGITVQDNFIAHLLDPDSATTNAVTINEDLLLQMFMRVAEHSIEFPDSIVVSPTQYQFLARIGLIEGQRQIFADRINSEFKIGMNVNSVGFQGHNLPIMIDMGMPSDDIWFLNRGHIALEVATAGSFVPVVEGGSEFFHYLGPADNADEHAAFWVEDSELWVDPSKQGRIYNLNKTL